MVNDFPNEFPEEWDWFVREHIDIYNRFYDYWLERAQNKDLPVYFIRFEDILLNQRETVEQTVEYLLALDSVRGRYIEKRLDECIGDLSNAGIYKPRSAVINGSMKYFSKEYQELVKEGCRKHINYFGYSEFPG